MFRKPFMLYVVKSRDGSVQLAASVNTDMHVMPPFLLHHAAGCHC